MVGTLELDLPVVMSHPALVLGMNQDLLQDQYVFLTTSHLSSSRSHYDFYIINIIENELMQN